MCEKCDYGSLLKKTGLASTSLRKAVLTLIGSQPHPVTAAEMLVLIREETSINKVTLYRILDLLVKHKVIERFSAGDRVFRYGMADSETHPSHPHFFCIRCGLMECLNPIEVNIDLSEFQKKHQTQIKKIEMRVDGLCQKCLHQRKTSGQNNK